MSKKTWESVYGSWLLNGQELEEEIDFDCRKAIEAEIERLENVMKNEFPEEYAPRFVWRPQ